MFSDKLKVGDSLPEVSGDPNYIRPWHGPDPDGKSIKKGERHFRETAGENWTTEIFLSCNGELLKFAFYIHEHRVVYLDTDMDGKIDRAIDFQKLNPGETVTIKSIAPECPKTVGHGDNGEDE